LSGIQRRAPVPAAGPGRGQVLVIFAIALTALFAAAGLAFDIGRFYAEQRFLQNSADAGALAAASALVRGATTSDAANPRPTPTSRRGPC
jgi:Flp pilus assembly protein TadG